jgi:hypothetical protein
MTVIWILGAAAIAAMAVELGMRAAIPLVSRSEHHFRKLGDTFIKCWNTRKQYAPRPPRAIVFAGIWWCLAVLMIAFLSAWLGAIPAIILTIFPGSLALYWGARHITRIFR